MKPRTHVAHDDGQRRLAVLIDADNAQASVIEGLLAEVAKFGLASVKRIYGVVGDSLGGILSDRIFKKTGNVRFARLSVTVAGFAGALLSLLPILFTRDITIVALCLSGGFFFAEITIGPMWSIPMDIAPKYSGTAAGLMNTGSAAAAIALTGIDEVLVARIASAPQTASSAAKSSRLSASRSGAASITIWQGSSAARCGAGERRVAAAAASATVQRSRSAPLARSARRRGSPRAKAPSSGSWSRVS